MLHLACNTLAAQVLAQRLHVDMRARGGSSSRDERKSVVEVAEKGLNTSCVSRVICEALNVKCDLQSHHGARPIAPTRFYFLCVAVHKHGRHNLHGVVIIVTAVIVMIIITPATPLNTAQPHRRRTSLQCPALRAAHHPPPSNESKY